MQKLQYTEALQFVTGLLLVPFGELELNLSNHFLKTLVNELLAYLIRSCLIQVYGVKNDFRQ